MKTHLWNTQQILQKICDELGVTDKRCRLLLEQIIRTALVIGVEPEKVYKVCHDLVVNRTCIESDVMKTHKMWTRTDSQLPPERIEVETKIDDEKGIRNQCTLIYHHKMWWCSDIMHTYYEPTHWRHA